MLADCMTSVAVAGAESLRAETVCEVDVWDGSNGEPVVKHGYTVTTEVP